MRMKNKKWSKPYLQNNQNWIYNKDILLSSDWENISKKDHLCLEIGTGKGDFISFMAEQHPDQTFLGVEKVLTCLGFTGKKVEAKNLSNVRLFDGDVVDLFSMVENQTFQTIYLNFSDPWPKKRHTKRRLTFDSFLKEYARILKKDGELIMKTDNADLFHYSVQNLIRFGWSVYLIDENYDGLDTHDACTEYEAYFRSISNPIYRLKARKPIYPSEFVLFYDYKKTGDLLKIVKDSESIVTSQKKVKNITAYYHHDRIVQYDIEGISDCMKIHSSGWIFRPMPIVVDVVSSILENAGFSKLPYVKKSGYTIVIVKEKIENGWILSTNNQEYTLYEEENLSLGDIVIYIEPGTFLSDGKRQYHGSILHQEDGSTILLDEKELIGKDFFEIHGGEK